MSQPLNVAPASEPPQQQDLSGSPAANRHRRRTSGPASTHHFAIAEVFLTIGLYPNRQSGEIFIRMAEEGSSIAGLLECFGLPNSWHQEPQATRICPVIE